MTLLTGKDADVNILTRLYQLDIRPRMASGGDLAGFMKQVTSAPPYDQILSFTRIWVFSHEVEDVRRLQDLVKRVMEELHRLGRINIGVLGQINSLLHETTPFFEYRVERATFRRWTDTEGEPDEDSLLPTESYIPARGPKVGGHDLSAFFVPLENVSVFDVRGSTLGPIRQQVAAALLSLIGERRRIGQCEGGPHLFVMSREDQRFCSHRCSARISARRRRASESAGKRAFGDPSVCFERPVDGGEVNITV